MLEKIDFSPGIVTYNDFDESTISLITELKDPCKDLLLVEYPNYLIISVDWHIDKFTISIINKYDWDNPIIKKSCKSLEDLKATISECVAYIRKILIDIELKRVTKLKMFDDLDFSPGKIQYLDIYVDTSLPLKENWDTSNEKLAQIDYSRGISLCVDWQDNEFVTSIFKYDYPTIQKKSKKLEQLKIDLEESIIKIRSLIKD